MGTPHEDLLKLYDAQRSNPKLFHDRLDANFLDHLVGERNELVGAHVNLFPRATAVDPQGEHEAPGVDPLDGDINRPEFKDFAELDDRKINIACIVEHNPSKQSLKKFGVDEQREVIFHFPFVLLQEKGLVNDGLRFRGLIIGDLVEWDSSWYYILSVHRGHYLGQSDHFFVTSGTANRYRLDALRQVANNNLKEQDP